MMKLTRKKPSLHLFSLDENLFLHFHAFMRLIFKRHHTSVVSISLKPSNIQLTKESEILTFCRSGSLSEALRLLNCTDPKDIAAKPFVYGCLLQTSTKLKSFVHAVLIHAHTIKSGLEADRLVGNSLLSHYLKFGRKIDDARKVFDKLLVRDGISWTSMVTGYTGAGFPEKSLEIFWDMLNSGVEPDAFTLSAGIKACSALGYLASALSCHGIVFRRGFDSNHVIASALINMYGRNDHLKEARRVFDELLEWDAVCWTSVISALTRNDSFEEALRMFHLMQRKHGLASDGFTYGSVLTACGNLGKLKQGKEIHAKVITAGFYGNVFVESSLVDMYGKCGMMEDSRHVFDQMPETNSVSCCALLGGYCHSGDYESVINLYRMMKDKEHYCFGTVLRACAGVAAVKLGKEIHCQYLRRVGWRDVIVQSALVDLYAKCGCIDYAQRIFVQIPVKNLITWNSMISGFAQNGRGPEAVHVYNNMVEDGIQPDHISFLGVLFACSHVGFVDIGRECFTSMSEEYGIRPGMEHLNCMVNILGRAGLVEEAEALIEKSDCKNASSLWSALLCACTTGRNFAAAERIAWKIMALEPANHLSYVQLSNMYKAVGRWNEALDIRKLMKGRGVEKMPGKSWVESEARSSCFI